MKWRKRPSSQGSATVGPETGDGLAQVVSAIYAETAHAHDAETGETGPREPAKASDNPLAKGSMQVSHSGDATASAPNSIAATGIVNIVMQSSPPNEAGLHELIVRLEEAVETLEDKCVSLRRDNNGQAPTAERLRDVRRRRHQTERFLSVVQRLDQEGPPTAARLAARPNAFVVIVVSALTAALAALGTALWLRWGAAGILAMLINQGAAVCLALAGLAAWRLRPRTPAGFFMTLLGEVALISNLAFGLHLTTDMPGSAIAVIAATCAQWAQYGLATRLLLGIAAPAAAKAWLPHPLVRIAWILAAAGPVLLLPLKTPLAMCHNWCGKSPFHWNDDANLYLLVRSLYSSTWVVLALCGVVVIVTRFLHAGRRHRRNHGLALISAGSVMLAFALGQLGTLIEYISDDTATIRTVKGIGFVTVIVGVVAIPVAFGAAVLGEQASFAGVAQLFGMGGLLTPSDLEEALQTALRDRTLRLVLFPSQKKSFSSSSRSRTLIGDPPLGMLIHDRSLLDEPDLLYAATNATLFVIQQWGNRTDGSDAYGPTLKS
ncbi:hypothetical protein [Streptomyces sp. NPDC001286]